MAERTILNAPCFTSGANQPHMLAQLERKPTIDTEARLGQRDPPERDAAALSRSAFGLPVFAGVSAFVWQHSLPLSVQVLHVVVPSFAVFEPVHFAALFPLPGFPHVFVKQHSSPFVLQVVHLVEPALAVFEDVHCTAPPPFPVAHVFCTSHAFPLEFQLQPF